ncbi:hypothetical protein [Clostridium arbusti]|uniref:hypothetical protein n=1 Tax=Clostridium arbusti TaxID=1137848 RepID=UPI00028863E0|nr:hypothetical protein [Clostridium arbusti]
MGSFLNNTIGFWQWFQKHCQNINSYDKEIYNKNVKLIGEKLNKLFGNIYFVIETNKDKNQLILDALGDINRNYLKKCFKENMPEKLRDKWDIPVDFPHQEDNSLALENGSINDYEIITALDMDKKKHQFNIRIFCERFLKMPREDTEAIAMMMVYRSLGELYMNCYAGNIIIEKDKNSDFFNTRKFITLHDLYSHVSETIIRKKWGIPSYSGEIFTPYNEIKINKQKKTRRDIVRGATSHINLCNEYFSDNKDNYDFMKSVGADYIYIFYENGDSSAEEIKQIQEKLQNTLINKLNEGKYGQIIGYGYGQKSYTDLVVFDLDIFNKIFKETSIGFPKKLSYLSFNK